jgi:hypothetical protein
MAVASIVIMKVSAYVIYTSGSIGVCQVFNQSVPLMNTIEDSRFSLATCDSVLALSIILIYQGI